LYAKVAKNVGDILTQKSEEQPEEHVVSRAPPPDGYGLGPQAKGNKGKESQPNAGNPFQTLGPMLDALSSGGKASGLGGKAKDAGSFQTTAEQQIPKAQAGAGQKPQGLPTNLGNPFQTLGSMLDGLEKGGKVPDKAWQQDEEEEEGEGEEDAGPPVGGQGAGPPAAQGARPGALQGAAGAKGGRGGNGAMGAAGGKGYGAMGAAGGKGYRPNKQPQTPYPNTPYSPWWENCRGQCGLSSGKQAAATVSIKGINMRCRRYPDNFIADGNNLAHFSSPSRVDVTCWSPSSPGTVGFQAMQNPFVASAHLASAIAGRDLGYLRTRTGCYISVAEVNEQYISYPRVLNQCKIASRSKHWVGTLQPQYARKDCYACPSLGCPSQDLGSVPFVDLDCWTIGDVVRSSPLWIRSKEKKCYFPGQIFDDRGWAGKDYESVILIIANNDVRNDRTNVQ
jgi:hypothetical protein